MGLKKKFKSRSWTSFELWYSNLNYRQKGLKKNLKSRSWTSFGPNDIS